MCSLREACRFQSFCREREPERDEAASGKQERVAQEENMMETGT